MFHTGSLLELLSYLLEGNSQSCPGWVALSLDGRGPSVCLVLQVSEAHRVALSIITYIGCSITLITQIMAITVFTCLGLVHLSSLTCLCFAYISQYISLYIIFCTTTYTNSHYYVILHSLLKICRCTDVYIILLMQSYTAERLYV